MSFQKKTILYIGLFFSIISCAENTSSNEDTPIDDGGLTQSVYVRDIQPIFNESCATSGCHASSSGTSGIKMSTYTEVMASTGSVLGKLVIPNDAANSSLIKVIEGTTNSVARMPLGGSSLSSSDINKIKDWINNGAQN